MTEAERYLDEIPMWASKKNSLQDIRDFLGRMGNPDRSMNLIHVAGTNGKGSVCAFLASVLGQAGYDVAAFISPHLVCVRERFLHNRKPAGEEEFLGAFRRVRELSQVMAGQGYARPTYFEFLFYMFMDMAKGWSPDFVILETGLGGLLDATNAVERPLLAVITSISLDHMQHLGDTVEKIAGQKAGILKCRVPVAYDAGCEESRRVIEAAAARLGCPMYPVAPEDVRLIGGDGKGIRMAMAAGEERLELDLPSRADYQMMNAGLAVRAAQVLRQCGFEISARAVAQGIRAGCWPGRMEEVLPGVFLDGAHNAGGMQALARAIERMQGEDKRPVALMFGAASDKEYREMIEELCARVTPVCVVVAQMNEKRSAEAKILAEEFKKRLDCPVRAFDAVEEAWECLLGQKGDGLAFCAGSLYLVGEVKALLESRGGNPGAKAQKEWGL